MNLLSVVFHKIIFSDMTAMFYSAIQGFLNKIQDHKLLLDLLNIEDNDGNIALHYAAFRGNIEIIKELIKQGCNHLTKNFNGLNVLHLAAQGDCPNVLIFFKEKYHMDILEKDTNGSTPLHWACFMSSENAINYLISWMSNVNIVDNKGQSPLLIAIYSKRVNIIKKLLNKGSDTSLRNTEGYSIMDITRNDPSIEGIFQLLTDYKPFKLCYYTSGTKRTFYNAYSFAAIAISYITSILFLIVSITLLISFSFISTSNPGIIVSKYYMEWLEMIENKIDVNEICPYCKDNKNALTKHCHLCGHCVEIFDHHCNWINNCIGERNGNPFIFFLSILMLNLAINFIIGLKAILVLNNNPSNISDVIFKQPFFFIFLFIKSFKDIASILIMITSIFFIIPVSFVMFTQIRNRKKMTRRPKKER